MNQPGAAMFPRLLSPFTLGNAALKNRFVFLPHYTALPGIDGMPNEDIRAYHVERAIGGVGLIIDGGMAVMAEGMESRRYVRAWDPRVVPFYASMTEEIHAHGTKIIGQLTHGGHTSLEEPPPVLWAPTQMPEPSSQWSTMAMDLGDIRRTIRAFAVSSRNLMDAGFDGVEVKIAHDGLLRSFASPFFNRRTDAYGGTFENRMRLPIEVLEAIRTEIGPDYPIGIRLCLHEYTPFGYELDYGLRMAEILESSGLVSYFNCDAGTFSSFWMQIPPAAVEQGFFRPLNRALKQSSNLPVIAFGRLKQPALAERMLELGEADLIGMARQLIADPEFSRKVTEGRADEIRACIACNDACIHQVIQDHGIRCIQNPGAGQERFFSERLLVRAETPKNVVVVGGGPAGLKVAEIAARRGHKVTLLERSSVLGGQVRLAARQPLHEEVAEVTAYLEAAVRRLGVDVWVGVEADVDGVLELEPDVVIVATGSQPDLPAGRHGSASASDGDAIARERGLQVPLALPGIDLAQVMSTDEVLEMAQLPGKRALIIDAVGHWEAAGTAEYLADAGLEVEMVTARPIPAFGLEAINREFFMQRAKAKGIKLSPLVEVRAIDERGVDAVDVLTGSPRRIEGTDFVVPVFPRRSRDDLYFGLLDRVADRTDIEIRRIGDAAAPRLIQSAIHQAHQVGTEI